MCDDLLGHASLDEGCLHPLKLVLRNLHRLHDITRVYEAAHAAHPHDEGTMLDLFASYVRCVPDSDVYTGPTVCNNNEMSEFLKQLADYWRALFAKCSPATSFLKIDTLFALHVP